jgi:hypothetical protein
LVVQSGKSLRDRQLFRAVAAATRQIHAMMLQFFVTFAYWLRGARDPYKRLFPGA